MGTGWSRQHAPTKHVPGAGSWGIRIDRSAPQLGKGTMHNAPLGCSRTLGWDRGTHITPWKTQSRLTRERCSGRTEKKTRAVRAGPERSQPELCRGGFSGTSWWRRKRPVSAQAYVSSPVSTRRAGRGGAVAESGRKGAPVSQPSGPEPWSALGREVVL